MVSVETDEGVAAASLDALAAAVQALARAWGSLARTPVPDQSELAAVV